MDSQGFNKLNLALQDAGIEATVTPEPYADQDIRFITIETDATEVPPAHVLNALAEKSLMYYDKDRAEVEGADISVPPRFEVLGVQPGSVTLDDVTVGPGWYGL